MRPFLKWAGSKARLADEILPHLKAETHSLYIEPFLGSGAIGLPLAKYCRENDVNTKIILSDANPNLMNLYAQIRDNPEALMKAIDDIGIDADYYAIRDRYNSHPTLDVENAALFIWLVKRCYRGIYRVNKAGLFNTPKGEPRKKIYRPEDILAVSRELNDPRVELRTCDYSVYNEKALYYLDPPYVEMFNEYHVDNNWDSFRINSFIERLQGSTVYISNNEKYIPPDGTEEIYSKVITDGACRFRKNTRIEKLYKVTP